MALVLTPRLNDLQVAVGAVPISVTSAAFTPTSNSLLIAMIALENGGAGDLTTGTSTVSGGGWTWTRRGRVADNDGAPPYTAILELWTAPVTTGASMSLTVANTATNDTDPAHVAIQVVDVTGYNVTIPIGATASGINLGAAAGTITLSAAPDAASVVVACRQYQLLDSSNSTATPGSGWTEIYDEFASFGYGGLQSQSRTGSTSTSVDWADLLDTPAVTPWASSALAVEILADTSVPLIGSIATNVAARTRMMGF
jgi:hypothetical protein